MVRKGRAKGERRRDIGVRVQAKNGEADAPGSEMEQWIVPDELGVKVKKARCLGMDQMERP